MLEMTLTRNSTSKEGTFGLLESEALEMHTGELPWHNNTRYISCIPVGEYLTKPHRSYKHGKCFWLQGVPNRSEILIHAANYMGDISEGYKSQLAGCIALGMRFGLDAGENQQDMILDSMAAIKKLIEYTEFKPFWLKITNNTDVPMEI